MTTEGAPCEAIAVELGFPPASVMERASELGFPAPAGACTRCLEDADRDPLPPGHPRTWRTITDFTLLHGSEYPLPVLTRAALSI